jgi:hypothetical protein
VDGERALGWLKTKTGADLAPEQADAVKLALTRKVAVLTGGPGCGKSFTVRSVVELARARKAKVVLAAPTGRGGLIPPRRPQLSAGALRTGQGAAAVRSCGSAPVGGRAAVGQLGRASAL